MKLTVPLYSILMFIWTAAVAAAAPVILITPEEAALKEGPKARSLFIPPPPPAPQIIVVQPPKSTILRAPFPIMVRFSTSEGAKIDVTSVKVEVIRVITISITDRVKPYLSETGINVPDADIPKGKYNLRITLKDSKGRVGQTEQNWEIQ